MDIAKLSMTMSNVNTMNEFSMRVMKLALDQMKDVGKLMEGMNISVRSLDPDVGQLLDISV